MPQKSYSDIFKARSGEDSKQMKIIYIRTQIKIFLSILFTILSTSVLAATGDMIGERSVTVTVDIPEPTCTVSAPATVNLGVLIPGMEKGGGPDVNIRVDCGGQNTKHVLYMLSSNTLNSQHNGIFLKQKDETDTGVLLQLEGKNSNKFTVDEQKPEVVSSGAGTTTHQLKVQVGVPRDAKPGEVGGMVVFRLAYTV
ncbi:fimbrial protein [Escherichia coli]